MPKNILPSKSFTLRYDKNSEGLKVGIVVSKKVDRRAVVRNRIRRRIAEFVRRSSINNLNLVFYVRKHALENQDLKNEVNEAVEKIQ